MRRALIHIYKPVIAGAACTVFAGTALPSDTLLEEIIVTAQKREESLQSTPVAVTAFSQRNLEGIGAFDVTEVNAYAPNVQVLASPASNSNIGMSIRGISSGDPALSYDPKVGLYLDGVYIAKNSGAVFDVVDLERIEILRGPQGTLWGKNTTGGAINLVAAKPSGEFGIKQMFSAGSDHYRRSRTTIDLPAYRNVSGKLSLLRSFDHGVADNNSPNAPKYLGTDDTRAWRAALRWNASETVTVDYSYEVQHQDGVAKPLQLLLVHPFATTLPSLVPGIPNPFVEAAALAEPNQRLDRFNLDFAGKELVETGGYNVTVSWDLGGSELKSITARRYFMGENLGNDPDGGAHSAPIYHSLFDKRHNQLSQELQWVGSAFEERLDFVFGAFYFEEEASEDNPQYITILSDIDLDGVADGSFPLGAIGVVIPFNYTIANKSTALYSQLTYTPAVLDDKLSLTLGMRYTRDEKEATLKNATILDAVAVKDDWSNFTPTFIVEYQVNDDVNIYGKLANGYNAGLFNIRASTVEAFLQPVAEEDITSFELGIKSEWFGRRLRVNASVFSNEYKDLQVTQFKVGATGASSVLANAGLADAAGIEVEVVALPVNGLMVAFNYGYVDVEYKEYLDGAGNDISHLAKAPYTPENTASLLMRYDFPSFAFGQLSAQVDATYSDGYTFNPILDLYADTKSRTLTNARLTLSDIDVGKGQLRVALWGKNLADKAYREWGIDFGVDGGVLPFAGATFGDPRSFGIDLIYEY